jgi:starch phosphorylase
MPRLPEAIGGLKELAYNLWWSWNPEAAELFLEIDPVLWKRFRGNPVKLLLEADPARLSALCATGYPAWVQAVVQALRDYLKAREVKKAPLTAYFSAEYGFHSSLPIYSGGLGFWRGTT